MLNLLKLFLVGILVLPIISWEMDYNNQSLNIGNGSEKMRTPLANFSGDGKPNKVEILRYLKPEIRSTIEKRFEKFVLTDEVIMDVLQVIISSEKLPPLSRGNTPECIAMYITYYWSTVKDMLLHQMVFGGTDGVLKE